MDDACFYSGKGVFTVGEAEVHKDNVFRDRGRGSFWGLGARETDSNFRICIHSC